jgi:hypothetical protein
MYSTIATSFKRKLFSVAVFASLGCVAVPASAAVVHVIENGILIGANNVEFDGTKYDVRFVAGSAFDSTYNRFFFDFNTQDAASSASDALHTMVFTDSRGLNNTASYLISGCSFVSICDILTPFAEIHDITEFRSTESYVVSIRNDGISIPQEITSWVPWEIPIPIVTVGVGNTPVVLRSTAVIARWYFAGAELPIAPIPEPSTYAIMGLGLFGVIGMARRHQNKG